jgi:hypothetical protein
MHPLVCHLSQDRKLRIVHPISWVPWVQLSLRAKESKTKYKSDPRLAELPQVIEEDSFRKMVSKHVNNQEVKLTVPSHQALLQWSEVETWFSKTFKWGQ